MRIYCLASSTCAAFFKHVLCGALLCLFALVPCAVGLDSGAGSYIFRDPDTGESLNVWYYKPDSFSPDTPVVLVMHGANRNAGAYRDVWQSRAEIHGFMILAPELSKKVFPGQDYAQGRYFEVSPAQARKTEAAVRVNPPSRRSLGIPDKVFADFAVRETTSRKSYYIYGHGAGAQFVQRMLVLHPSHKAKMALVANAGWYTLPALNRKWPYGLKGTWVKGSGLDRYLSFPLVVLLGADNTNEEHRSLRRTPRADHQGKHRLERGRFFFQAGLARAQKRGVVFGWRQMVVCGVGHNNDHMAGMAASIIANDVKCNP